MKKDILRVLCISITGTHLHYVYYTFKLTLVLHIQISVMKEVRIYRKDMACIHQSEHCEKTIDKDNKCRVLSRDDARDIGTQMQYYCDPQK